MTNAPIRGRQTESSEHKEDLARETEPGLFEVLMTSRFVQQGDEEATFDLSIMPQWETEDLTVRLDISLLRVTDTSGLTDWRGILAYTLLFLDELRLEKGPFSLNIAHDLIVPGDPFGIVSPSAGLFDPVPDELRLMLEYNGESYSHRLSYSDITLASTTGQLVYTYQKTFSPGTALSFSLVGLFDHSGDDDMMLFPEASFHIPLHESVSLSFTGTLGIVGNVIDGWGLSLSTPVSFDSFDLSLGLAWTQGSVQYGRHLAGYQTGRSGRDTLMLFSSMVYETDTLSLVLDAQVPIERGSWNLVRGEDYVSIELSTDIFGVLFSAGTRMTGLMSNPEEAWKENAESFISLGYSNSAIETSLALHFDRNLTPRIVFNATMYTLQAARVRSGELSTSPRWLDIALETGFVLSESSNLFIRPTLLFTLPSIGSIGVRLPFHITSEGGVLSIGRGSSTSFGIGAENTLDLVYSMLSDLFSLIDSIHLGSQRIHFYALRDGMEMPSMLREYSSNVDDTLSLSFGFTIPDKATVEIFIDDAESPRLADLVLSMMPMGSQGPRITGETVLDILFTSGYYEAVVTPRFAISQSFSENVTLTIQASTILSFSPDDFTFNLTERDNFDLVAGGEVSADISSFSLTASGGVVSGVARDTSYDSFALRDGTQATERSRLPFSAYASLSFSYTGESFFANTSYSLSGIGTGLEDDILLIEAGFETADFTVTGKLARRNLYRTVSSIFTTQWWTSSDMLYELSIEKEFGHLGFKATLYSESIKTGEDQWMNSDGRSTGAMRTGFSVMTSLRF